jgi:hypothetical protein
MATTEETGLELVKKCSGSDYLEKIKLFSSTMKYTLATTRFTNFTWEENCKFRERNPKAKSVYLTPEKMSKHILPDSMVVVLEMNNDTNQIMGIGLIKNTPIFGKYSVYKDGYYNRYAYIGTFRLDVSDMTDSEKEMIKLLEAMCFKGCNHLKRGRGITRFPLKLLMLCYTEIDLMNYIRTMLKLRME